ncbi:MAG: hypothetical protein WC683_01205 [bacterium]
MYEFQAPEEKVAQVRAKYEALINRGREEAVNTLTRIEAERPQDFLVPTDAFRFRANAHNKLEVALGRNGDTRVLAVHPHALDQGVSKTNIMGQTTARRLLDQEQPWSTDLLADALNRIYTNIDRERLLFRAVGDQVRGILSDRYRCLDSGPIFEHFVRAMQGFGAVPTDGHVYDTKVTLTMTLPTIFDPVPTDPRGLCVVGATLKNSDFGAGALDLRLFVLRVWCLNGAMRQDAFRQVHLGRRLDEDFAFSDETRRLDTQASISAMGDVIGALMRPERINEEMALLRRASETEIDVAALFQQLRKVGSVSKSEEKALVGVFNTPDVEMLPPGNTLWRASNAISLFAQDQEVSADRALELQILAGSVLDRAAA